MDAIIGCVPDVPGSSLITVSRARVRACNAYIGEPGTSGTAGTLPAHPALPSPSDGALLALDLGTTTGWALRSAEGVVLSGIMSFRPSRFDGGGMRYLRFRAWLEELAEDAGGLAAIWYEEVRRHLGTDASHVYGGMLATLTAWAEQQHIPYAGVPVGTIKQHATGRGNAGKPDVIAAMQARGYSPADDNEADALALLHWAVETRGGVR